MTLQRPALLLTLGVSVLAAGSAAYGQANGPAQVVSTASIASTIEFNDNYDLQEDPPGDTFIWSNLFQYDFRSFSPIDTVIADISGVLRYWDVPQQGGETAFDDPTVRLDYERSISDNSIGASVFFNKVDVDFYDPLSNVDIIDDDGNFDNTTGGGERRELRGRFFADLGQEAPISFSIGAFGRVIEYDNTTDPDLDSRNNFAADAEAGFLVTPILRAILAAGYAEQNSSSAQITNRQRTTVQTGFDGEIDERSSFGFRIGYSRVNSDREDQPDETNDSTVGSLDYSLDLPNGSAGASFSSSLTENGTINTLSVARVLEFRTGSLSARIGGSNTGDVGVRPIGQLSYISTGRRSEFRAQVFQALTVDDESRDVLNSFGAVSYNRSLSRLSSLDLSARAGLTRYENVDQPDSERLDLTAQFNRQVTRDWAASLGYRYRNRDDDESDSAQSNAVFFTVRRDFRATR